MAASSGGAAGIVSIVLGVAAGVGGILYYLARHTRRGIVLFIGCGVLLILGIVLIAIRKRPARAAGITSSKLISQPVAPGPDTMVKSCLLPV
jgi:cyanate permease